MKIRLLMKGKKGLNFGLESYLNVIKNLYKKYPDAVWKRISSRRGNLKGYELEI